MKFVLYYVLFLNIVAIIPSFCEIENFEDDEEKLRDLDIESTKETVETLVFDKPIYKTPVPSGTFFFAETFDSLPDFKSKWITSKAHKDGAEESVAKYDGEWRLEEAIENPLKGDLGLVLKSRAKHHAISAKLDRPFHFTDKPFIVQYEVKFQNGLECGGAYIKLLTEDNNLDLEQFHDKTQYTIMFGPDKCGNSEKLHFIFQHKNPVTGIFEEKHAKKVDKKLENVFETKMTHLFTLAIHPDNTFDIYVDGDLTSSGSLLEDFTPAVNPPSEITDPDDKKPADWDDREKIPDPDAVKPEDWDEEEPEKILDPNAVKPAGWLDEEPELIPSEGAEKPNDWDDDVDGEWEPPLINNPKCEGAPGCGEWSPPQISNPNYKGRWDVPLINNPDFKGKYVGRMIPNPDYFEDKEPFRMTAISALGLELWSMTDDIYFDNFIVTNDKSVADQWADDGWKLKRAAELSRSGQGILSSLNLAIEERPWILVVITLTIGLGIILLIIYCVKPTMGEGLWSWFEYFLDLAAKYPAIWGLYAVVMLLPFVVASIFLCPNSGPLFKASDIDKHKKDDDSAVPEDTEADGFQVEEEEPLLTSEPSTGDKSPAKDKSKPKKEKKLPKSDGEGDNASSESAEGDIEDEGNEEGESVVRNRTKLSPQKRKTKARKD